MLASKMYQGLLDLILITSQSKFKHSLLHLYNLSLELLQIQLAFSHPPYSCYVCNSIMTWQLSELINR